MANHNIYNGYNTTPTGLMTSCCVAAGSVRPARSSSANEVSVASCSSDTTVKLWKLADNDSPTMTLTRHHDYVKALAFAPQGLLLVSAGLDRSLCVWDLSECLSPVTTLQATPNEVQVATGKSSIYSLAIDAAGHVALTGSIEKFIRAWDLRSGKTQFKLRGHRDNIKALVLSAQGTLALSASCDHTIRLWDLGQQRCVHTFNNLHTDSVWTLAVDQMFSKVFSGGRDGNIFATDIARGESTLLCREESPVLKLLLSSGNLWTTTTSSAIKAWVPNDVPAARRSRSLSTKSQDLLQGLRGLEPVYSHPNILIKGRPGIVRSEILSDRLRVLTQDNAGTVALWDVTKGKCIEQYGSVCFEDKSRELYQRISIPSWFSVDIKTGLSSPQCFSAEIYAHDAGLSVTKTDPTKGEHLLRALFTGWLEMRDTPPTSNAQLDDTERAINGKGENKTKMGAIDVVPGKSEEAARLTGQGSGRGRARALPPYSLPKDLVMIISREGMGGTLYRGPISELGSIPDKLIPPWVRNCLLHNKKEQREAIDFNFQLLPANPKDLERLPRDSNLTAHRAVKVRKVMEHIQKMLGLQLPQDQGQPMPIDKYLEVVCNGQVLSAADDLATVKTFVWKAGGEMVLYYQRKDTFLHEKAAYSKKK